MIFRIAAIAILLLTGAELLACEVFSPATCEIAGGTGERGTDSGDACFCCCFHVLVSAPLVFERTDDVAGVDVQLPVSHSSFEPARIYHPPKS
jgi:hypothetical protein